MKHAPRFLNLVLLAFALAVQLPTISHSQQKDNLGKEFYVAFAHNEGGGEANNLCALYITSKVATQGLVEVPAIGFSQVFKTTPGSITTINLPAGDVSSGQTSVEVRADELIVQGMAVHITADDEVAVYGMNHKQWSSDAFLALPVDVLGTQYRTLNYPTSIQNLGGFGGAETPGEFWLVGVNDSTNVTITPRARTYSGRPKNVPFKVLLYKGDVYLVQGDPTDRTNDLTGSLIESDQSVAVFSGHVRTEIPQGAKNVNSQNGSRDHLVEQMPPVSAWGDSALVIRYATASLPDLVRIVSAEDGNQITVNGTVVATLQAGDFYEIGKLTAPVSIQATNPILVGQYMHTSQYGTSGPVKPYGDPALALVFPVEQFADNYTFISIVNDTAFIGNFVNVVADRNGLTGMVLDGAPIAAASFQPIPGSNYVYAQIKLKQGTHNILGSKPFGITVYALGNVDSYAYPGGTLLKTITPFKTVDLVIDFGDRPLTVNAGPPITYSGFWDSTVYLQNISSDPYVVNGFVTQGGNAPLNFKVVAPPTPRSIGAGVLDSMTIRFSPDQPDIRMHTKITAQTEHLRAYVVDVYGRGILENAQVFSDSNAIQHIDTLDFGVFDWQVDGAKDSFVYVFNKGGKDLQVLSQVITGSDANDFKITGTTIASAPKTLPYILPGASNISALAGLQFVPSSPNGIRTAEFRVRTQGQERVVILIARVRTIFKSSVTNAVFDTAYLCQDQTRSIFIDNPNDFPITVTKIDVGGLGMADFSPVTQIPLVVQPFSRGEILIRYSPAVVGLSAATATLSFDLPKNYVQVLPLNAIGVQLTTHFFARGEIHILPGENVLFPIFAKMPMQLFGSSSFVLTISYDPSHIADYDYMQDNTLTATGSYTVNYDTVGYRQYAYQTLDNSTITGGGADEVKPLIYIKFKSHLNPGDDPNIFRQDNPIAYDIVFDKSPIPSACIASVAPVGHIILDSTCERVYLSQDTLLYSSESAYIEPVFPNPVTNGVVRFRFDVPKTINAISATVIGPQLSEVHLEITDMMGIIVATPQNGEMKSGSYEIQWNASRLESGTYFVRLRTAGQIKYRQMVIVK